MLVAEAAVPLRLDALGQVWRRLARSVHGVAPAGLHVVDGAPPRMDPNFLALGP